jgi:hypothetical protein
MAAVGRIPDLAQAVVAGRDVGRDRRIGRSFREARLDRERRLSSERQRRAGEVGDPGVRERQALEGGQEFPEGRFLAFRFDRDAAAVIPDEAAEAMAGGEA